MKYQFRLLALFVLLLVVIVPIVGASPPELPTFQSPPPEDYPPLPPINNPQDIGLWVAGAPALVLAVVEVLKRLKVIPDGSAGRWTFVGNVFLYVLFLVLGLFKIDVTGANVTSVIEILTEIGTLITMVVTSPFLFKLLRDMGVLNPLADRA